MTNFFNIAKSYLNKAFKQEKEQQKVEEQPVIQEPVNEQNTEEIQYIDDIEAEQGWECPKCGRVYSPITVMCLYCPETPKQKVIKHKPAEVKEQEPIKVEVTETTTQYIEPVNEVFISILQNIKEPIVVETTTIPPPAEPMVVETTTQQLSVQQQIENIYNQKHFFVGPPIIEEVDKTTEADKFFNDFKDIIEQPKPIVLQTTVPLVNTMPVAHNFEPRIGVYTLEGELCNVCGVHRSLHQKINL